MPSELPGQSDREVTLTLTVAEARWVASYALRNNDWVVLGKIEAVLEPLGLDRPMDVYVEVARLRDSMRKIGEAVGAKANGADARAVAKMAREALGRG